MTQYADILNMPFNEMHEPQPTPLGTYTAVVKEMPRVDKGGKNNNTFIETQFALINAESDVDGDALSASGGLPKDMRHTFWLTPKSGFIYKKFVEALGIDTTDKTPGEVLAETVGRAVKVTVVLGRLNPKTGKQYPEISEFAVA